MAQSPPTHGTRVRRALVVLVFAALALVPRCAHAKRVWVTERWDLAAPPQAILDSMMQFEDTCERGCKHQIPRLVKTVVLPYERRPDDFYVWMFIEDIQDAKWFSHVTVRRSGSRTKVVIQMVSPSLAARLEKTTGLEDDPAFDECFTVYDLETVVAGAGPPRTRLTFTSLISLSGLAAFFGSGIAHGRLEEAAHAVHRDLAGVKP